MYSNGCVRTIHSVLARTLTLGCCKLRAMVAGDFFCGSMDTSTASVRDIYAKRDLGNFTHMFNATVPPMDALLLKLDFR